MKRYINYALIYAIIAMIAGVFYRFFTLFYNFTGKTTLSVIHTHYFALGMIFFILLVLFDKVFSFNSNKINKIVTFYNIGLNITGIMLLCRGITQVINLNLTHSIDMSISGLSGIGHIVLSVSMILLIINMKRVIKKN